MEYASEYGLDDEKTSGLMDNVQQYVHRLRELQWAMIEKEEEYKKAKEAYESFSRKTVPDIFKMNGIDALMTETGQKVAVVTKTTCSITKSKKELVAKWLQEHGAGDLIKEDCTVPITEINKLEQAGIIFERNKDMNTNSVKAFLLDALGQKGGTAIISQEDIPDGISFYQWDEMEITEANT